MHELQARSTPTTSRSPVNGTPCITQQPVDSTPFPEDPLKDRRQEKGDSLYLYFLSPSYKSVAVAVPPVWRA
jgi:hypothetical protein